MINERKKSKTRKIRKNFFNRYLLLEKLAEIGETTAESLLTLICNLPFIFSRYRGVNSSLEHEFYIDLKSKIAWWSMLSKLKKEGLVYQSSKAKWKISAKGVEYLKNNICWLKKYKIVKNLNRNEIILVIFDIPEYLRIKRDWLRFQLENLGFKPLQKSVWYSNNLLPKDFIEDLKYHNLLPHIHILSVNKKGTLSKWFEE